jgi:hypothetical protein
MSGMRDFIIASEVRDLKKFGYSTVSEDNILTDPIFSAFFKSHLQDALADLEGMPVRSKKVGALKSEITKLIAECVGLEPNP